MNTPNFVHLHMHTEHSLLDGIIRVKQLPQAVKEMGMNAVSMTDHGTLSGALDFYKECTKANVKPLIGLESYTSKDRLLKQVDDLDQKYYHLLLLAQNEVGYKNLCQLVSTGNRDGYYYKGRLDDKLLEQYSEGLIATSTCLGGRIAQLYRRSSSAAAEKLIMYYADLFKDRFFLEIQHHPTEPEQVALNNFLLEVSSKYNIPPILSADCHYLKKSDGITNDSPHEQMLALNVGSTIHTEGRFSFDQRHHYVLPPEEVREICETNQWPLDLMTNTQHIADMCTGKYFTDCGVGSKMPEPLNIKVDSLTDLTKLGKWGLVNRFGSVNKVPEKYKARLNYELEVIHRMGYSNYFLIVKDLVDAIRKKGIAIGPGRGSAAGSLLNWALGITSKEADPIKHDLYFERFLNAARTDAMVDVDLDFPTSKRHLVFDYLKETYGEKGCAHLGTYQKFKARGLMWALARVQGHSIEYGKKLSKLVPEDHRGVSPTLEEAIEASPELLEHPKILSVAEKIEGMTSRAGVHASGYIVYNDDLGKYMPVYQKKDAKTKKPIMVTQMDMHDVEEMGFVKFDILGIQNLDVVSRTLDLVEKYHNVTIDLDAIDYHDDNVFALMREGRLAGVFQLEDSLRNITVRVQPTCLNDISVVNAIGRPGPLDAGLLDGYVLAKEHGLEGLKKWGKYGSDRMSELLWNLLPETYGLFIYQESVMRLLVEIAGFSLAEADLARRAMGKKKPEEMNKLKKRFVPGAIEKVNATEEEAETLWKLIQGYSLYGFNKSHSLTYSILGYQEAWLKKYYPVEFMTALLSEESDINKITKYISECKILGIKVEGPNVNKSLRHFSIEDDTIVFGLEAIKGMGRGAVTALLKARGSQPFKDISDLLSRVNLTKINSAKVEALTHAGALDCLGLGRQTILDHFKKITQYFRDLEKYGEKILRYKEREKEIKIALALREAGEKVNKPRILKKPELPEKPTIPAEERREITFDLLQKEKEVLGYYLSIHPTDFVTATNNTSLILDVCRTRQRGFLNGVILQAKEITTKKGTRMAFLTVEDATGQAEVVVFPGKVFKQYKKAVSNSPKDKIVRIEFTAEDIQQTPIKLIAERIRGVK